MEETLTCITCNKQWTRQSSRGRKPKVCPSCLQNSDLVKPIKSPSLPDIKNNLTAEDETSFKKTVFGFLYPKPTGYKEMRESTKNGSTWKCPGCAHIMRLSVAITTAPTHRCTPDMVSIKIYDRID